MPALLVVGWVGLFAYSAAYLTEDMPFRNRGPPEVTPAGDAPAAQQAARRA